MFCGKMCFSFVSIAFASSFCSINIDFTHVVIFFILFVYFSIKKLLEEEMLLSVLCESKSEV